MKRLKDQQGYALIVVLLVVVLFLTLSATFMAGSLNNARQEKTVDTTNQALASAEMGARFYNSDFERELGLIKTNVSIQAQEAINVLILCIKSKTDTTCDEQTEIDQEELEIDLAMRARYIDLVMAKIEALHAKANVEVVPFSADQINYAIVSATGTKLDAAKDPLADQMLKDTSVKFIQVALGVKGTSENVTKELDAFFTIEVPDTFLNYNESITVETVLAVDKEAIKYTDIFPPATTLPTCDAIVTALSDTNTENDPVPPYECDLTGEGGLSALIDKIKAAGVDPVFFKVHTDNFAGEVCDKNCNNLDFAGVTIVVNADDTGAFNNMNNLINAKLLVNGTLTTGNNLINLGKNGNKQVIIVKELDVGTNIQNMYYTNFLVLGNGLPNEADLKWGANQHFEIDNYSNLCIDIDSILQADLTRLAAEVKLSNTGKLIYYTADPNKEFVLTGKNAETMSPYVYKTTDYTTFLNSCGVVLKDSVVDSKEVAVPYVLDPEYEFYVEY